MPDVIADSSAATTPEVTPAAPATVMLPTDAEYRKSGKQQAAAPAKPKPAESAPAKESSEPDASAQEGETGSASEASTDTKQEKREPKPRSTAETRLKEVLEDLKRAGLSPAELKTFKREAHKAEAAQPKTPEHTEKPVVGTAQPPSYEDAHPKPKLEDFDSIEAHTEALTDWKLDKREFERAQKAQAEAQAKAIADSLSGAKQRYGEEAEASIRSAAREIASDQNVPAAVKDILSGSELLTDVLYTLASKEGELASFMQLARENPAAAIRKAVLLEHLIAQELSGKGGSESDAPGRDESGKFVSKAPAKKITEAPPPPREAAGRQAAPPDDVASASKTLDFSAYKNAANRRDVARSQGR